MRRKLNGDIFPFIKRLQGYQNRRLYVRINKIV